jgi:thiazole synthase
MLTIGTTEIASRLLLGTALYDSPEIMRSAIQASGATIVTASIRRQAPEENGGSRFWDYLKDLNLKILPNTAGCHSAEEAVTTAEIAREIFGTNWIKLEVIGDDYTLQPDPFALVAAAKQLCKSGFEVFPYCTTDLIVAQKLQDAGCNIIMPWAAPIGTGQGPTDLKALELLRRRLPDSILIVDAGIGRPSHAAQVMELGYDAVLLNSAVALSDHPEQMALGFRLAVEAGRAGYKAGIMDQRDTASPSTPTIGMPFWHQAKV